MKARTWALFLAASFASSAAFAARDSQDPYGIQGVKKKIHNLKFEISDGKKAVDELDRDHRDLLVELHNYEESFQARFSKVLLPLLNWPSFPPARRGSSWVEQEHIKLVLGQVRERLTREPLELIAGRELMISKAQEKKETFLKALKDLEIKEGHLSLQLEELQMLQKKFSQVKKK